jgi:hypothetical protein
MIDMSAELRSYAQELNEEFRARYREDATFRANFNDYLRGLGVNVVPELGEPTRH